MPSRHLREVHVRSVNAVACLESAVQVVGESDDRIWKTTRDLLARGSLTAEGVDRRHRATSRWKRWVSVCNLTECFEEISQVKECGVDRERAPTVRRLPSVDLWLPPKIVPEFGLLLVSRSPARHVAVRISRGKCTWQLVPVGLYVQDIGQEVV